MVGIFVILCWCHMIAQPPVPKKSLVEDMGGKHRAKIRCFHRSYLRASLKIVIFLWVPRK